MKVPEIGVDDEEWQVGGESNYIRGTFKDTRTIDGGYRIEQCGDSAIDHGLSPGEHYLWSGKWVGDTAANRR